jgi:membrane associated rhomboid family serine protease
MFLLWYLGGGPVQGHMKTALGLYPEAFLRNYYFWQPFTYLFVHGGIGHLLFNMLALWMFGTPLEQDWGTRRFLKYYFLCGIGAGLCDISANVAFGHWGIPTIGASGALYGLLLAFGVLYPETRVLMNFLFPIKAKYLVIIYGAIALLSALGENSGVSNVAHLGGMLFGYVYLKGRWPAFRMPDALGAYRQWRLQRAKKKFQVYMRKHDGRGPWVN